MDIEKLPEIQEQETIINTASLNDFVVDENLKALAPRIGEDDERGLIESIKKEGLLEPISVLPEKTNGKWRIVDGFQRFTVIKENKLLKEIPCRYPRAKPVALFKTIQASLDLNPDVLAISHTP